MTIRTEIGRTSRRKGIKAELDLAKYLRQWWPAAERSAVTGWRTKDRVSEDHGDIRGTDGLVWQLKYVADMSSRDIENALADAEDQAVSAGADYGILVQRRPGKSDPGRWWGWVRVGDLCALTVHSNRKVHAKTVNAIIRIELCDLIDILLAAQYGADTEPHAAP